VDGGGKFVGMRNTRSIGKAGSRRRRTVEERCEIVERYLESGLTQRVFAREVGISVSSLRFWLRQASEEIRTRAERAKPVSLLEVELDRGARSGLSGDDEERECGMPYEIELPRGVRLRLGPDFADAAVSRLLALLWKEVR
jgi:transposase-like protein